MNKNLELKKLKMKYFWEQKFLEVSKCLGMIILIVGGVGFLPYWLGRFISFLFPKIPEFFLQLGGTLTSNYWVIGFLSLFSILIIITAGAYIYEWVHDWVSSNLKKAEKRARSELKMNMKVANKLSSRGRK